MSICKTKPIVKLKSKLKYEEIEWRSEERKTAGSSAIIIEKATSKVTPLQELKIIKMDDNIIPKRIGTRETTLKKLEPRFTAINRSSQGNALRRVKFDHPYSNGNEPSSNVVSVLNRCAIIPTEYQSVNVNKLYYLNGESSSELNSFMIHETLNQPVNITK